EGAGQRHGGGKSGQPSQGGPQGGTRGQQGTEGRRGGPHRQRHAREEGQAGASQAHPRGRGGGQQPQRTDPKSDQERGAEPGSPGGGREAKRERGV
ncbi:hypothetical protein C3R44_21785, partial [Mycobacterium tuberculosis]